MMRTLPLPLISLNTVLGFIVGLSCPGVTACADGSSSAGSGTGGTTSVGAQTGSGGVGTHAAVAPDGAAQTGGTQDGSTVDSGTGGTTGDDGTTSTGGTSANDDTTSAGGSPPAQACGGTVTLNPYPFGCEFAWGANGNDGNRSSYLDFITTWVGYEYSQGREGDCDGCGLVRDLRNTDAVPVYYAYFIGYALDDCNVNPNGTNLCNSGAAWIRNNRDWLLELYGDYARMTYQSNQDRGVVWLLEGDFVQYTYDEQSEKLSMGEIGTLARDITCAIRSNAPNAVVSLNHSPWLANEVTDEFWRAMPLDIVDFVWTTGTGTNDGYINASGNPGEYNATTARYEYLRNLTGKPLWVDTSFGPSQQEDSWSSASANELNARIAEGVMASNVTDPPGDYENRIGDLTPQLDSVCR